MFCLVQDDDTHWYVIPVDKKKDWYHWLDEGDLDTDAPAYAVRVGGAPNLVQFPSYEIA